MKLIFDENLSPKLPSRLNDLSPNSLHVREVNMESTDDSVVWNYAKKNNFVIVSKDSDMHDLLFNSLRLLSNQLSFRCS